MEKYLVASTGDTLDSKVSGRFGHAGYFLVVNPRTLGFEVYPGVSKEERQHIGKLINPGIKKVIVGNIGPSAYKKLTASGCAIYLCRNMSVVEALQKIENNEVPLLEKPTLAESILSSRKHNHGERKGTHEKVRRKRT